MCRPTVLETGDLLQTGRKRLAAARSGSVTLGGCLESRQWGLTLALELSDSFCNDRKETKIYRGEMNGRLALLESVEAGIAESEVLRLALLHAVAELGGLGGAVHLRGPMSALRLVASMGLPPAMLGRGRSSIRRAWRRQHWQCVGGARRGRHTRSRPMATRDARGGLAPV